MSDKPNWNRMQALQCAAITWQGRPIDEGEDRTGNVLGTADRMLAWLDGYAKEAAPAPDRRHAPGGWIGPNEIDLGPKPDESLLIPRLNLPGLAEKVQGLNEVAARLRADIVNSISAQHAAESAEPEAPPRNVPTEGDGSMTVPVYRFYRECVDPDCKVAYYWREDTRNATRHRWSLWLGEPSGEPEDGIERWAARKDYDQAQPGLRPAPESMTRLTPQQLHELDIPAETRYDSED